MDIDEIKYKEYYKRQISINSFGTEMQKKLSQSKCLIVGLGGLGCPAALYLSVSGVGKLGLCDYDEVEFSNLGRQVLFSLDDVGRKKAEVAHEVLSKKNTLIDIVRHTTLLNESNIVKIISEYDIILDCTDNFHVKYLIHDTCLQLKKDLVQGSLFQTQGQVLSFAFSQAHFRGCMRCLWKDEPAANCVQSCAEAGILSVVAGTVALRQATSVIQHITGNYKLAGISSLYTYSNQTWMNLPIPFSNTCTACVGSLDKKSDIALEVDTIHKTSVILDVRNESDQNNSFGNYNFENVSDTERSDISLLMSRLDKNKDYTLMCYAGIRSLEMAKYLKEREFTKVHSYAKGYSRFAQLEL